MPVLGVFAMAFAFTTSNSFSETPDSSTSFLSSENIAFAQDCGYKPKYYCIVGNTTTYDEEYCGTVDPGGTK